MPPRSAPFARILLACLLVLTGVALPLPLPLPVAQAQEPLVVSFPGNYGQAIGAPSWAPDDPAVTADGPDAEGLYTLSVTLPRGDYEFKVAIGGSWEINFGLDGAPSGANIPFSVGEEAEMIFSFAPGSNAIGVTVGGAEVVRNGAPLATAPEAPPAARGDGQIDADALLHQSRHEQFRSPFGAAPFGATVTLRLRTAANDVESAQLLVDTLSTARSVSIPMQPAGSAEGYEWWVATFDVGDAPAVHNYKFQVNDGGVGLFYGDDGALDGGTGAVTGSRPFGPQGWDIYTYDPAFEVPEWAQNAVIYQIFPDRFRNGDPSNDPQTGDFGYPEERGQSFAITPWNTIVPDPDPNDPSNPWYATWNSTFYGGDLQGVQEKLDYLQSLGVNTLYFTPINEAATNHRYDARDYRLVDDSLAVKEDADASLELFTAFAADVEARGMHLILDGVPNHTSSDNPMFDRFGRWETVGACESEESDYRERYLFDPARPEGSGVCAGDANYRAFAGVSTLPQADTANEAVMEDWLGENGIATFWLDIPGVDGWRIDTVPDVVAVNPTFFEPFRAVVKAAHPDAVLIAETWPEDAVQERLLGDEFDTTMNYRFARALLGFLRDTEFTGTNDGAIQPLSPSQFEDALRAIQEDYPPGAFAAAMNLISSHDFNRAVRTLDHDGVDMATMEPVDGFADGKNRLRLAALLQFTLPGAPTVFYGDEVGLVGFGLDVTRDDPHNRQPYPWEDAEGYDDLPDWRKADAGLLAHYQRLGALRAEHSYLRTGSWDTLLVDDEAGLLVYGRRDETGAAVVAINRSTTTQTVTLDTTGYLPWGAGLTDAFSEAAIQSDGTGQLSFAAPPLGFRLYLTDDETDVARPPAPQIEAVAANGAVTLTVTGVMTHASLATQVVVARIGVDGAGVGDPAILDAGEAWVDADAPIGVPISYRAATVWENGMRSDPSPIVSVLLTAPIESATLGGPATITHTISAITPTVPISGVVLVPGVTEAVGAAEGLRAELGSLPEGLADYAWVPGTFAGDLASGDVYTATLLPAVVGSSIFRWRFSNDGGETWTESDAGQLTVLPSDDTEAPKPPFRMDPLAESNSYVSFAWRLSRPRDLAHFLVCRADLTTGEEGCAVETIVPSVSTVFTDTTVTTGHTYSFTVRVVDTSFNVSEPSDAITRTAELSLVDVTFRVLVPAETPPDATIYIAGDDPEVFGAAYSPALLPLEPVGDGVWEITRQVQDGTALLYKYTRGSWETVEQWGTIAGFNNRELTVAKTPEGTMLVEDTATDWGAEGPDDRRGVQTWRDPLVLAVEPAPDAVVSAPVASVRVTFSILVTAPDAATVLSVTDAQGAAVPGAVAIEPQGFVFTPETPLGAGSYTATAFNVEATTPMVAPYAWSFTVE